MKISRCQYAPNGEAHEEPERDVLASRLAYLTVGLTTAGTVVSFDFSGSTVLVNGGTSGIGNAIAAVFAKAGAAIFVPGYSSSQAGLVAPAMNLARPLGRRQDRSQRGCARSDRHPHDPFRDEHSPGRRNRRPHPHRPPWHARGCRWSRAVPVLGAASCITRASLAIDCGYLNGLNEKLGNLR
jgi:hypothetical protein